jgi:peptidoglycan hydrolase-like protein with peptidoglycan-binding domain
MTVEAMSSLPLQAGGAMVAAAGRTALWVISIYMRQPLRNTALAALIGFSALASANALYKQHHHPAPLFGSFADNPAPVLKRIAPVMPAERPARLDAPAPETTGSVDEPAQTPAPQAVTNADVTQMQQKLASLGLYSGAADGLFGPKTARALKAFEASIGRPQRGLLTPAIVATIEQAPMPAPIPPAPLPQAAPRALPTTAAPPQAPAPVAQALPQIQTQAQSAPVQVASIAPLKPLAPLGEQPATQSDALPAITVPAATPQAAADAAAAAPETVPMNKLPPLPRRVVPTIAVHVQQTPAGPVEVADATPQAATPAPAADESQAMPSALAPAADGKDASTDPKIVSEVQRGLNSLGFLHQQVDGVAGEATAKAIRNFEVYFNYNVTGRVTKELVNLLQQNGGVI